MTRSTGTLATTSRNAHLVRFEGVRLGSRRAPLLADLTLAIHPGQFWCFLTAPGPLRRALVRTLLGIARWRGGITEWNRSFSTPSAATARIGFVPGTWSIPAGLSTTVREFVSLGLIGIRRGGASEAQRIGWALEQLGFADRERSDVTLLSACERVSVLVARALARRPRLLVVEEPTSPLDREKLDMLLEALTRLEHNERLTIAWFTTDIEVPRRYATHVALPAEGKLRIARQDENDFETVLEAARISSACTAPLQPAPEIAAPPLAPEAESEDRNTGARPNRWWRKRA